MSLKQHDRVRLTLTNDSIYSGDIVQINETRMKITNIYDERSQSLISGGGGQMIFYRNEVKTAYRVPTTNEQIIAPAISNDDDDEKEIISCWPAVDNNDAAAKLPNDLMIELTEMTVNHIYVKSLLSTNDNDDYSRAMNRLENCETLSVVGLGNCTDHTLPLSLLVLSTYDQVYIFDMYRMANCRNDNKVGTDHGSNSDFMSRLKSIFESHEITKIIHGGKALVHCLANTYGINLENIFDTQVGIVKVTIITSSLLSLAGLPNVNINSSTNLWLQLTYVTVDCLFNLTSENEQRLIIIF